MSNLKVTGNITMNGKQVKDVSYLTDYLSYDTIYSSSSVSTGDKGLTKNLINYKLLIFAMYNNTSSGWVTCAITKNEFITLSSSNYGGLGIWVEQNMSTTNRRARVVYVDDRTIGIRYIQNCSQLVIYGLKNYS